MPRRNSFAKSVHLLRVYVIQYVARPNPTSMNRIGISIVTALLCGSCLGSAAPFWEYQGLVQDLLAGAVHTYELTVTVVKLGSVEAKVEGSVVHAVTYALTAESPEKLRAFVFQVFEGPYFARWPMLSAAVSEVRPGSMIERAILGMFTLFPQTAPCWDGVTVWTGLGPVTEKLCLEDLGEEELLLLPEVLRARVLRFFNANPDEEHEGIAWWIEKLKCWGKISGKIRVTRMMAESRYEITLVSFGELSGQELDEFMERLKLGTKSVN